jgi:hypothetical protein
MVNPTRAGKITKLVKRVIAQTTTSPHLREVEHNSCFADAVTGEAVAAAADGERKPALARERDDVRDVGRVRDTDDHGVNFNIKWAHAHFW